MDYGFFDHGHILRLDHGGLCFNDIILVSTHVLMTHLIQGPKSLVRAKVWDKQFSAEDHVLPSTYRSWERGHGDSGGEGRLGSRRPSRQRLNDKSAGVSGDATAHHPG